MREKNYIKQLQALIQEHIGEEEVAGEFYRVQKLIERELKAWEYKLKRTLRDRQISTNVLNQTVESLKEKSLAIERQKELIEEQSKFKEELFANVSHELRTPLHGILGMNQLLEKTDLCKLQKNYVDIIKSSADNLLVIINDLLSFSQINAGKIKIIEEPFPIYELFGNLEDILSLKARKKGLQLIFMSPPNLPKYLMGDSTRLYQVLLNLLNNAIKFTEKGYIALNCYVLHQTDQQITLQFEIRDTGIGIKPERLDAIFESFTRVHDNHGIVYEGAGLGLNIVKNLLNLMEGEIDVESELGKGTVFHIRLDLNIPDEKAVHTFKNRQTNISIPPHWQYKNLLLIEDNKANVVFAKNLFLDWGIELDIAETAAEARQKLKSDKYDCILSDVKLPDGNGLELIKDLRNDDANPNQHTPVIVLTASSNEKEAAYSRQIKVQSYIGKPFKTPLLVEELRKLLDEPQTPAEPPAKTEQPPTKSRNTGGYFTSLKKNFKGKKHLMAEIIDIFLKQIPGVLQNMEAALLKKDIEKFHFQAHLIKSTINNIGMPHLHPLILKLDEYSSKKIHLAKLPALFEDFKKQALEDIQILSSEKEKMK